MSVEYIPYYPDDTTPIEWKEWDDTYEVSNMGTVRRKSDSKLLKQYLQRSGYVTVFMHDCAYPLHRVVAHIFHPQKESNGRYFVDHINTNRSDNRASNLRWASPQDNSNNPTTKFNTALKRVQKSNPTLDIKPLTF